VDEGSSNIKDDKSNNAIINGNGNSTQSTYVATKATENGEPVASKPSAVDIFAAALKKAAETKEKKEAEAAATASGEAEINHVAG